jgi:hypothetical protein
MNSPGIMGPSLGKELVERGLCPSNAINIELHIPAGGVLMIRYEVLVEDKDLLTIAEALKATVKNP